MKKYTHGFVVGKFMPLHTGHIFLLETAQAQCQGLTILVFSRPSDPIPGAVRIDWIQQQFPDAEIIHNSEPLPKDESQVAFWDIWRKSIEDHCRGRKFEAVFSSEAYGERLAKDLGAEHVEVDRKRTKYPISGRDIRANPSAHKDFIPKIVRPYYEERLS